jgi:hypothetical protein
MKQLTDEQVEIIEQRIRSGLSHSGLVNDILDHYCCYIEEQMNDSVSFDDAYTMAFQAISPNGVHEIQEELFYLLTFKKQTNMKRITYGLGFLAAFLISTGFMFRIFHWPFAGFLMSWGFGALFTTMLMLVITSIKRVPSLTTMANVRTFAGLAAGLLIASGNLFKLHYWPTANIQMLVGMVVLNVLFLPMLFYHMYQQALLQK